MSMGKVCGKCGYERRPNDICPDYECPRCGIIYAKFEAYEAHREKLQSSTSQYLAMSLQECEAILATTVLEDDLKKILADVITRKKEEEIIAKTKEDELRRKQTFEKRAKEKLQLALASKDYTLFQPAELEYLTAHIVLTTETSPIDMPISERLEIITAECVYGMNVFRDFFASVTDFFGGRSLASQNVLRDARRVCLSELKREALMVGADAVVGVDLDYSEMTGGGKSGMLFLVASGTAVRLRKA